MVNIKELLGFGKKDNDRERKPFPLQTFLIMGVVSVIALHILAQLFGNALGFEFKAGPIFILMGVASSSLVAIGIARKILFGAPATKADVITFLIIAGLTLFIMFFLPGLLPSAFEQSAVALQSVIGL